MKKSKAVLTPSELSSRWGVAAVTLAMWRFRDKEKIKNGLKPSGPKYFKITDSKQGEVRYYYEDILEFERRGVRSEHSGDKTSKHKKPKR